ncbi:hypothetical protein AABB24_009597 [Solanum stoloniferum]|uniref:Retrotransposon gag domain-containing protein n=1 Tax=Solanum stoloniferum TaxID=62892 RepID=A0ABD2UJ85_9SOLN
MYEGDLQRRWERCNSIVVLWLMSSVQSNFLSGILFRSDAYLVWNDLKERFDKVNNSRAYHLHKEIATVVQGISSVSMYYSKLKDLWDEHNSIIPFPTCACERSKDFVEHLERQKLFQFLMGLNDGYAHARSQILTLSPEPSVNQAYAMIIQDESQNMLVGGNCVVAGRMEPSTFYAIEKDATTMYSTRSLGPGQSSGSGDHQYQRKHCDFCNMKGHTRADCYKLQKCEYFLQKGHVKENCYKLIGYPENFKGKKRANVATHPLVGLNLGYNHGPQATEHGVGVGPEPAPALTQHQYNQIVKMLNKCSIGDTGANMGGNSNYAANTASAKTAGTSFFILMIV